MGNEAEHIYKSMTFATSGTNPEDANDYATVLRKFEAYFIPRRNVIHERAKLYQRVQNPGEEVETFIRNMYELAESSILRTHELMLERSGGNRWKVKCQVAPLADS